MSSGRPDPRADWAVYRTVPITRPDTERSVMRMAWQKSVVLLFALLMRRVPLLNQRVRSRVQPGRGTADDAGAADDASNASPVPTGGKAELPRSRGRDQLAAPRQADRV